VIADPYKLSEAREAFRRFGAGTHNGKIVITMERKSISYRKGFLTLCCQ
jgi:hypothetical protein